MISWDEMRLPALTLPEVYAQGDRLLGAKVTIHGLLIVWPGTSGPSDSNEIVFPSLVVEMFGDFSEMLTRLYADDFMPKLGISIEDKSLVKRLLTVSPYINIRFGSKFFLRQPVVATGTLVMTSDKSGVADWRFGLGGQVTGGLLNLSPGEDDGEDYEVILF